MSLVPILERLAVSAGIYTECFIAPFIELQRDPIGWYNMMILHSYRIPLQGYHEEFGGMRVCKCVYVC